MPLLGPLADCDGSDHLTSLEQTGIVLFASTTPIWLGTLLIYATGTQDGYLGWRNAFFSTMWNGELFMYCTALLSPIFWMALVDPPGAKAFPSKISHMVLIGFTYLVSAAFFGVITSGAKVHKFFTFRFSVALFIFSVLLLYLGTLYHASRLPDPAEAFKQDERAFTKSYGEHRQ